VCRLLTYEENIPATFHVGYHPFLAAFLSAYNAHEDVTLSPDDVWMVIMMQFSQHVNDNAENLRSMVVEHDGKKQLIVTTAREESESEWTEFCTLMLEKIRENVKGGVVDVIEANFSTTTRFEKLLSTMAVMSSFKQYFSYGRCIPECGINNIHFLGTLEDWQNLIVKLNGLKQYGIVGNWNSYVTNLEPILQKFVDTYEGNVDVEFWNKIMNIRFESEGSGSSSLISGWILNFFGKAGKEVDVDEISIKKIDVTVKIDNRQTRQKKNVNLLGGFSGFVNYTNGSYRPQMSYAVYYDGVNNGE
jgi:hypothetical protein